MTYTYTVLLEYKDTDNSDAEMFRYSTIEEVNEGLRHAMSYDCAAEREELDITVRRIPAK